MALFVDAAALANLEQTRSGGAPRRRKLHRLLPGRRGRQPLRLHGAARGAVAAGLAAGAGAAGGGRQVRCCFLAVGHGGRTCAGGSTATSSTPTIWTPTSASATAPPTAKPADTRRRWSAASSRASRPPRCSPSCGGSIAWICRTSWGASPSSPDPPARRRRRPRAAIASATTSVIAPRAGPWPGSAQPQPPPPPTVRAGSADASVLSDPIVVSPPAPPVPSLPPPPPPRRPRRPCPVAGGQLPPTVGPGGKLPSGCAGGAGMKSGVAVRQRQRDRLSVPELQVRDLLARVGSPRAGVHSPVTGIGRGARHLHRQLPAGLDGRADAGSVERTCAPSSSAQARPSSGSTIGNVARAAYLVSTASRNAVIRLWPPPRSRRFAWWNIHGSVSPRIR